MIKRVFIFSGTTEGRRLAETLSDMAIPCVVQVATGYGEEVMQVLPQVEVRTGRLSIPEMKEVFDTEDFAMIVDATHPFATAVSENIREAAMAMGQEVMRLQRDAGRLSFGGQVFMNASECAEALAKTEGRILLTTGSKDLPLFCQDPEVRERLIVRVLPAEESLRICREQGLSGKQIIAMQGPFSKGMNLALLKAYDIACMVTKESGSAGGFEEKARAADEAGVKLLVIGNPEEQGTGYTFEEVCEKAEKLYGRKRLHQVALIGMGMGGCGQWTLAAQKAIEEANVIFGADRLLQSVHTQAAKMPYYLAQDIVPEIDGMKAGQKAAVLFSGDTGFYSGCSRLYEALTARDDCEVKIYPGISSIAYLSAATGIRWQDAAIESIHGKGNVSQWGHSVLEAVRYHRHTFLLVSNVESIRELGQLLNKAGLADMQVIAGRNLSYEDEEIEDLSADACVQQEKTGLYTCLLVNKHAKKQPVTHGWPDDVFLRDKVPMSKEEIRALSICKLGLTKHAIMYDIGSGTGSIAMEAAARSSTIRVYAIEKKPEAIKLIQKNKEKFMLSNIHIVSGKAPEILCDLPVPTHVMIGGSGGNLKAIIDTLYEKIKDSRQPIRVVVNAITLETMAELTAIMTDPRVQDVDTVQITASRARELGRYHLMQSENPVLISSFYLNSREEIL